MAIYDVDGNVISTGGEVTEEQVRNVFVQSLADGTITLPAQVGNTLGLDTHLFDETYAQTTYASLLSAFKSYPNSVPFFINSDQHGRGVEIQRYVNNIDTDGMECVNINCGDSVVDAYTAEALESVYLRIKYVKNYIGVPGNHDYKNTLDENLFWQIRRTFCTTNLERQMITTDDLDCYVAYHPMHSVKFICIDPYDERGIGGNYMPHPYINSNVAEWIITELSRNDGNDIVILMHEPRWKRIKTRTAADYTTVSEGNGNTPLYDLFVARKSKTSGTYTDDQNVQHTYDFSNCETNLLCELGGHWHEETYCDVDGLTVYAQDWAGANKYGASFGLIDRDNNLLRIFSFDNVSGVKTELDITLQ